MSWVVSRRAFLLIHEDRLECGDWTVPYEEIEEALLFSFWSLPFPGYILRVRTAARTYQFGSNSGAYWKGELPFPVARERGRLRHSWVSIAARSVLLVVPVHLIWSRCQPDA